MKQSLFFSLIFFCLYSELVLVHISSTNPTDSDDNKEQLKYMMLTQAEVDDCHESVIMKKAFKRLKRKLQTIKSKKQKAASRLGGAPIAELASLVSASVSGCFLDDMQSGY